MGIAASSPQQHAISPKETPMTLLQPESVVATLRNLGEARLEGVSARRKDVRAVLDWLAGRYGMKGGERGMVGMRT